MWNEQRCCLLFNVYDSLQSHLWKIPIIQLAVFKCQVHHHTTGPIVSLHNYYCIDNPASQNPKSFSNRPALEETKLPFFECCLFRDIIEKYWAMTARRWAVSLQSSENPQKGDRSEFYYYRPVIAHGIRLLTLSLAPKFCGFSDSISRLKQLLNLGLARISSRT